MSDSQTISKSQFKARALELFRQVEASGETVVVTDHGEPAVEVRPFKARQAVSPLALLRGSVQRYDDPFAPVAADEWDALK